MSSYTSHIASIMLNRRRPISIGELVERTGASEKTVRNALTEVNRISSWLPDGNAVVVLRGHGFENQYCVRKDSEIGSSFKQGKYNWELAADDGVRAQYSPA